MTGVDRAQLFAHGYRGKYLETEKRAGMEHLVPGQHEAIWADDEQTLIELSYVPLLGHSFVIIILDGETSKPLRMAVVDVFGLKESEPPEDFALSTDMQLAITRLKTQGVLNV